MVEEFHFNVRRESEYDYLNGRVKVLESYLLDKGFLRRLNDLSFEELVKEISQTSYRQFGTFDSYSSISSGIIRRFEYELKDFEHYLSKGFINSFFRSKEIFLRVRDFALNNTELASSKLRDFLLSGKGDFPAEFKLCYDYVLNARQDSLISGVAVGSYYLKFLNNVAEKTKVGMIIDFYLTYSRSYFIASCMRLSKFVDREMIAEHRFNEAVSLMRGVLADREIVSDIFDFNTFKGFLASERAYYGSADLTKVKARDYIIRNLEEIIERAKPINTGIIPAFVYLLRLSLEVEELLSIVNTRSQNALEFANSYKGVLYE